MADLSGLWTSLFINVVVRTVAGGVTNAVAVWMLFHPHDKKFGFHGAIPKNRARLAKSIGRTVGERVLTPADIVQELHTAGLRGTMDAKLERFITQLLERDWGSLQLLPPKSVAPEVECALGGLGLPLSEALAREVHSPEFERRVRDLVVKVRGELAFVPVGTVLTPERRSKLAAQAAGGTARAVLEKTDRAPWTLAAG